MSTQASQGAKLASEKIENQSNLQQQQKPVDQQKPIVGNQKDVADKSKLLGSQLVAEEKKVEIGGQAPQVKQENPLSQSQQPVKIGQSLQNEKPLEPIQQQKTQPSQQQSPIQKPSTASKQLPLSQSTIVQPTQKLVSSQQSTQSQQKTTVKDQTKSMTYEEKKAFLETKLKNLQQKLAETQSKLNESQDKVNKQYNETKSSMKALKQKYQTGINEQIQKSKMYEQQKNELLKEMAPLEKQIAAIQEFKNPEIQKALDELIGINKEIQRLDLEQQEIIAKKNNQQIQNAKQIQKIEELNKQIMESKKEVEDLDRQIITTQTIQDNTYKEQTQTSLQVLAQMKNLQSNILQSYKDDQQQQSLNTEYKKLERQLQEQMENQHKLQEEIDQLKMKQESTGEQTDIEEIKKKITSNQEIIKKQSEQIEEIMLLIKDTTLKVQEMRKELEQETEENEELAKEYAYEQAQTKRLTREVNSMVEKDVTVHQTLSGMKETTSEFEKLDETSEPIQPQKMERFVTQKGDKIITEQMYETPIKSKTVKLDSKQLEDHPFGSDLVDNKNQESLSSKNIVTLNASQSKASADQAYVLKKDSFLVDKGKNKKLIFLDDIKIQQLGKEYLQLHKELLDKKQQYFNISMTLLFVFVVLLLMNTYYYTNKSLGSIGDIIKDLIGKISYYNIKF